MAAHPTDRALANRLRRLHRHWRWVLLGAVLCGFGAFVVSLFLPKIYRATTYILVSESKIGTPAQPSSYQYALLSTYEPFVDNDELTQQAISRFHLDRPPYKLNVDRFRRGGYLEVDIPKLTRLLEIRVDFPNPQIATDLANFFAQSAVKVNDQITTADTQATQKFLKQRMDSAAAQLDVAGRKRLETEERARVEDWEKEVDELLAQRDQLLTGRQQLQVGLAENESRIESLRHSLAGEPATIPLKKSITSDRFVERAAQEMKMDLPGIFNVTEDTLNSTHQDLAQKLTDSQAGAAAEKAGVQTISLKLGEVTSELDHSLRELTFSRNEISKVNQEYQLDKEALEGATRDYQNASVTVSANAQDLKQLAPAMVPGRPVRSRILLNTLLAFLLGLAILSATAMAVESFREMNSDSVKWSSYEEHFDVHNG